MPSKNLKNFEERLKKSAAEKNRAKRGVKIASVISEALREIGQDPTLVGGAAVEFYTEGEYATGDIDMLAPGGEKLYQVMENLGFKRIGKDFIRKDLEIYVEFPGGSLEEGEKNDVIDVEGTSLKIISVEDLIVDRLCAYKFWRSQIDGLNALLLVEVGGIDKERLQARASIRDVLDALKMIEGLYEEIFRKKINKNRATKLLRDWLIKKI